MTFIIGFSRIISNTVTLELLLSEGQPRLQGLPPLPMTHDEGNFGTIN